MSSTNWNLEELKNNCTNTIQEDRKIYIDTIQKKEEYVSFLQDKLSGLNISLENNAKIKQQKLNLEIYVETLVYNLHSLPDVIAHLIVETVLKPLCDSLKKDCSVNIQVPQSIKITPKEVIKTLQNLEAEIKSCPDYKYAATYVIDIKDSLQELLDSQNFKYISDLAEMLNPVTKLYINSDKNPIWPKITNKNLTS